MAARKGGPPPPPPPGGGASGRRPSPRTAEEKWNAAAWFNDHYSVMRMPESLQEPLLKFWHQEGNGAIELLLKLARADRQGPDVFETVARKVAEDFGKELREVYNLWRSPQLEINYGEIPTGTGG